MIGLQHQVSNLENNYTKIKGSLSPDVFYKYILNGKNQPDLVAISILSDIIYWYRPQKNSTNPKFFEDALQSSYKYFTEKFGFCREKTRRAFVRLEEMGLIQREYRTVMKYGHEYNNVLYIHLRIENVNKILDDSAIDKKICQPRLYSAHPSPQNKGYINKDYKKNIKSRSENESEFSKISSKNSSIELDHDVDHSQNKNSCLLAKRGEGSSLGEWIKEPVSVESLSKNVISPREALVAKSRILREFIPLSEALYEKIQGKTYKNYKIKFINQLLEKLAEKYNSHEFYSENAFVNYVAKALDNEIIEEKIANLESFTFDKNYLEQQRKNKFINEIESSINQDPVSQVKRKIASLFETEDAYLLLKNYKFPDKITEDKYFIESITEEGRNHILTQYQKERLFQEISTIFNIDPTSIEIIHSNKSVKYMKNRVGTEYRHQIQPKLPLDVDDSLWGRICKKLIVHYGEAVYISWFSKLTLQKNNNESVALILAPTRFISDWIQNNYYKTLKDTIKEVVPEIHTIEMSLQAA